MVQALCFAASTRFPPCNEARLCCTSGDQYVVVCCWFCLLLVSPRLFLHGLLAHKINFQIVIRYVIRKPHFINRCMLSGACFFFQTNSRYEEDDIKRAKDASRDAKFSAILAIVFGVAIAFFCIFIFEIVPLFA